MIFTPGFVGIDTQSFGGVPAIAISQIAVVGPTRQQRGFDRPVCTLVLTSGYEIVAIGRQDDVLQAIAEGEGAIPVGTGLELEKLRGEVQDLTRRLKGVLTEIPPVSEPGN